MTPAGFDSASGLRRAAGHAALLVPEIGARALRLPVFPGFAPLISEPSTALRLAHAVLLAVVEATFLGTGALELVAACAAGGAVAGRRRREFVRFTVTAAVVWIALGASTGSLGVGSFGIETLVCAVLVRATGSEPLAGALARLLLAALVYGSAVAIQGICQGICRRLALPLARLAPAALVALAVACAERESTRFRPEIAGAPELTRIDAAGGVRRPAAHPVLPETERTNAVCLSCHQAKVGPTTLPLARKGIHEIHTAIVGIDPACTSCHFGAGSPGFPGEHPEERSRNAYNHTCSGCHTGAQGPSWARRMR